MVRSIFAAIVLLLALGCNHASAQGSVTCPLPLSYGEVLTTAQWNACLTPVANGASQTGNNNWTGINTYSSGAAATARNCSGLDIDCQTTQGDVNFPIPSTTKTIEIGTALTAPRTNTLPCAASVNPGQGIQIYDPNSNISLPNSLSVVPGCSGSDTENGSLTSSISMWAPGSTLYAVSDGISNWTVHVAIPPAFSLDFATTFGGVVAKVPGTTSCTLGSASKAIACSGGVSFSAKDVGDIVTAEGCATNGALFKSFLVSVTVGTGNAIMNDQPAVANCGSVQLLSQVTPATGGLGLQWGGTETLVGSGAAQQQVTMTDGGVGAATTNSGGTGGTPGTCAALTLNPGAGDSTSVKNLQATFSGTITGGGALSGSLTVLTPADYKSFTGYTYDGSGNYDAVPVTGCGLSGATVNIAFTEQVVEQINIGVYASPPCSNSLAASSTSTSHATVLPTFNCNTGPAVQWIGADNQVAQQKAFAAQTQSVALGAPITVDVRGIFMTSGSNPSMSVGAGLAAAVTGPASWRGSGPLISGFYHITSGCPIASIATVACNDVFPVVNSNPSGAGGFFGWKGTDNQSGTFIRELSCWGDFESPTIDRCITGYGSTKWAQIQTDFIQNMTGHLFGVGADVSGCGTVQESNFLFIRSFHVGNLADREPVIGFDTAACGVGANNLVLERIRAFQDPYFDITIRPCNGLTSANGAHIITINDIKDEKSGLDGTTGAVGAILINTTNADCSSLPFPSVNGTPVMGGAESGVGGVWILASAFANPPLGAYMVVIAGNNLTDNNSIFIQGNFSSAGDSHGGGVMVNSCNVSCVVDSLADKTYDFGLYASSAPNSGEIGAGAVEFNGHGNPVVFYADPGLTISCSDGLGFLNPGTDLCQGSVNEVPGYRNRWYLPWPYINGILSSGTNYGSGTVVCYPIAVQYPITLSALGARIAVPDTGGNIQLAVYSNGSWMNPANLLASTPNISTTSSGAVSGSVSVSLTPGNDWLCMNEDNATVTAYTYSANFGPALIGSSVEANVIGVIGATVSGASMSQPFGTWPNFTSGSSWNTLTSNPPVIAFDVASSP